MPCSSHFVCMCRYLILNVDCHGICETGVEEKVTKSQNKQELFITLGLVLNLYLNLVNNAFDAVVAQQHSELSDATVVCSILIWGE